MNALNLQSITAGIHRCFFAVKFHSEITDYLDGIIRSLRVHNADIRWITPATMHLTLRVLGEIPDGQLDAIRQLPGQKEFLGFDLGARGLGAFPSLKSPSVFWAGVDGQDPDDLKRLLELQEATERWSQMIGLKPEGRRYRAHVTLGRVRRPGAGLKELVNDITVRDCQSSYCPVTELLLMRSNQGDKGAEYEVLERWKLGEGKV
jgi:2'-5' RNA ligase